MLAGIDDGVGRAECGVEDCGVGCEERGEGGEGGEFVFHGGEGGVHGGCLGGEALEGGGGLVGGLVAVGV